MDDFEIAVREANINAIAAAHCWISDGDTDTLKRMQRDCVNLVELYEVTIVEFDSSGMPSLWRYKGYAFSDAAAVVNFWLVEPWHVIGHDQKHVIWQHDEGWYYIQPVGDPRPPTRYSGGWESLASYRDAKGSKVQEIELKKER